MNKMFICSSKVQSKRLEIIGIDILINLFRRIGQGYLLKSWFESALRKLSSSFVHSFSYDSASIISRCNYFVSIGMKVRWEYSVLNEILLFFETTSSSWWLNRLRERIYSGSCSELFRITLGFFGIITLVIGRLFSIYTVVLIKLLKKPPIVSSTSLSSFLLK